MIIRKNTAKLNQKACPANFCQTALNCPSLFLALCEEMCLVTIITKDAQGTEIIISNESREFKEAKTSLETTRTITN